MRVLLDEDLPIRLRLHFPKEVNVETVEYRGWKGYKNGELLRAIEGHFDVFVTLMRSEVPVYFRTYRAGVRSLVTHTTFLGGTFGTPEGWIGWKVNRVAKSQLIIATIRSSNRNRVTWIWPSRTYSIIPLPMIAPFLGCMPALRRINNINEKRVV